VLEGYPECMDVEQLQEALSIGRSVAYKLLKDNEILHIRAGKKYLIPKVCVIEYLLKPLSATGGANMAQ